MKSRLIPLFALICSFGSTVCSASDTTSGQGFYIGLFGGAGSASSMSARQEGGFYLPGPLNTRVGVDAQGKTGGDPVDVLGLQAGYEWRPPSLSANRMGPDARCQAGGPLGLEGRKLQEQLLKAKQNNAAPRVRLPRASASSPPGDPIKAVGDYTLHSLIGVDQGVRSIRKGVTHFSLDAMRRCAGEIARVGSHLNARAACQFAGTEENQLRVAWQGDLPEDLEDINMADAVDDVVIAGLEAARG